MRRRAVWSVVVASTLALSVAACSDGGGEDAVASTSTSTSSGPATSTTPAPTTVRPTTTPAPETLPAESEPETTEDTTADTAPETTDAPTTTAAASTTTTAAPTTTVAPATTAAPAPVATTVPLPQPVAPPPPRAVEQRVEVGTIEIPILGVTRTLLEGISLNTLDFGPGHWPGTAMPGEVGNVVIAGHRTSKDRPFRHIDQLVEGDEVIFTTAAGRFVYVVTGLQIVEPDAMWIVGQTPEKTATLFACHPPGSTKQRIVVFLKLQE